MSTSRKKQSYSPEFRAEAVRQVIDASRPIAAVARDLGIVEQTLGNWVKSWRAEHVGDEPALSVSERVRLSEAERELREVKLENEFLKKCAAYFAKDRP
jgi:transposase